MPHRDCGSRHSYLGAVVKFRKKVFNFSNELIDSVVGI